MPVIKSAKKKLRQDKKRQLDNKKAKDAYKGTLKHAKANPAAKTVQEAFSKLDKAVKKGIIHANKAARLKSKLSKLSGSKKTEEISKAPTKAKKSSKTASKK